MELMFAPGHKTGGCRIACTSEDDLRPVVWTVKLSKVSQPRRIAEVLAARQIAAENAAWWAKEMNRWQNRDYSRKFNMAFSHAKYHFIGDQMQGWQCVYEQGQLYARDVVAPFDPKYGEAE